MRVKKQRNIKSWDQKNYLVIRGFCYIRPLYNEVPLYWTDQANAWLVKTLNNAEKCTTILHASVRISLFCEDLMVLFVTLNTYAPIHKGG